MGIDTESWGLLIRQNTDMQVKTSRSLKGPSHIPDQRGYLGMKSHAAVVLRLFFWAGHHWAVSCLKGRLPNEDTELIKYFSNKHFLIDCFK